MGSGVCHPRHPEYGCGSLFGVPLPCCIPVIPMPSSRTGWSPAVTSWPPAVWRYPAIQCTGLPRATVVGDGLADGVGMIEGEGAGTAVPVGVGAADGLPPCVQAAATRANAISRPNGPDHHLP